MKVQAKLPAMKDERISHDDDHTDKQNEGTHGSSSANTLPNKLPYQPAHIGESLSYSSSLSKELSNSPAAVLHEGPSVIVCGVDGTVFTMSANNGVLRGLFASGSELVSSSSMKKEEEPQQQSSDHAEEQDSSSSCPAVPQIWEKIVPGLDGQIYSLSPSGRSKRPNSSSYRQEDADDGDFGFTEDLQLTVLPINVLDITNQPVRTCHRTKPCRRRNRKVNIKDKLSPPKNCDGVCNRNDISISTNIDEIFIRGPADYPLEGNDNSDRVQDEVHNHDSDNDDDDDDNEEEETCGIVMGEKRSKLFAVNIQTGSVEWVHSHGERHVSPSSGGSKKRKRKNMNTVLLQREDYIVRHVDDNSGHETWNVTVGNFHALDFPSSNENDFKNTAKQNHESQQFFVPPRSATAGANSGTRGADESWVIHNRRHNNGEQNLHQPLLPDANSYEAMKKPLPWVSFSDDGRKIIAIDPHSRRVLWSKRLPSVIAAVYGVSENSSWRTITVVGEEEYFYDDDDPDFENEEEIDNDDLDNAVPDDHLSLTLYSTNYGDQQSSRANVANNFLLAPLMNNNNNKHWPRYYSTTTATPSNPFNDRQLTQLRHPYPLHPYQQVISPRLGILNGQTYSKQPPMISGNSINLNDNEVINSNNNEVINSNNNVPPHRRTWKNQNEKQTYYLDHGKGKIVDPILSLPSHEHNFSNSANETKPPGFITRVLSGTVSSVVVIVLVVIIILLGRYAYCLRKKAKANTFVSSTEKNLSTTSRDVNQSQNYHVKSPLTSNAERSSSEGSPLLPLPSSSLLMQHNNSKSNLFMNNITRPLPVMKRALSVDTLRETHNFQSRLQTMMLQNNSNSNAPEKKREKEGSMTTTILQATRSTSGLIYRKLTSSTSDADKIRKEQILVGSKNVRQKLINRTKSSRSTLEDGDNDYEDEDNSNDDSSSSSTEEKSSGSASSIQEVVQKSQQQKNGQGTIITTTTEPTTSISTSLSNAATASIDGIPLVRYSRYKSEFRELSALGKGGFGTVFKCENVLDGRAYAVKKIRFRSFVDHLGVPTKHLTSQLKRVLREVKILARLDHPNIVRYYTSWLELDDDVTTNPDQHNFHDSITEGQEDQTSQMYSTTVDHISTAKSSSRHATTTRRGFPMNCTFTSKGDTNNNTKSNNYFNFNRDGGTSTNSNSFFGLNQLFSSPGKDKCTHNNNNNNGTNNNADFDSIGTMTSSTNGNNAGCMNDDGDDLGFSWDRPGEDSENDSIEHSTNDDQSLSSNDNHELHTPVSKHVSGSSSPFIASNVCKEELKRNDMNGGHSAVPPGNEGRERKQDKVAPLQMQGHVLYIQMQLCSQMTVSDFLASPEQRAQTEYYWNSSTTNTGKHRTLEVGGDNEEIDHSSVIKSTKNKKINTSSCNIPHALQIFSQIAKGVQHVHKQGLIHRDLKPSNCFIDENGIVKVGDFGLSRETGNKSGDTIGSSCSNANKSGIAAFLDTIVDESFVGGNSVSVPWNDTSGSHTAGIGTRLYASPEQMQGSDYDASADVYSLGIILFELCYPMYTGMERILVLKDLHKRLFPKEWNNTIRMTLPNIHNLIDNMLSSKPKERPTSDVVATVVERQLAEFVFSLDISPTAFGNNKKNNPLLLRVEAIDTEGVLSRTIHLIKESIVGITIVQYGLRVQSQKAIMEFALDIPSSSLQEHEELALKDDDEYDDDESCPLMDKKLILEDESTSNSNKRGKFRTAHGIITKKLRESSEIVRVRQVSTNACLMRSNLDSDG